MKLLRIITEVLVLVACLAYMSIPQANDSWRSTLSKHTQDVLDSNMLIIEEDFFTNEDTFESTVDDIERYLESLSPRHRAYGIPEVIELSILSGGGRVDFFEELQDRIGYRLKAAHVKCNVGVAASMAFTFMLHFCDERVFERDTKVIQHQVYISFMGWKIFTQGTIELSHKYSDMEAEALGINKDMWYEVSREHGDKWFSTLEEFVYKLKTN